MLTVDHPAWNASVFIVFVLVDVAAVFAATKAVCLGWASTQMRSAVAYSLNLLSCFSSTHDDDLKPVLHRRLMETKVKNMRFMMQIMFFTFTTVTPPTIYTISMGLEREQDIFLTDVLQISFFLLLICPVLFPDIVCAQTLDIFYGLLMILCVMLPQGIKDDYVLFGVGATNLMTLALSWVRRIGDRWETLLFITLNLAHAFSTSWRFLNLPHSPAFAATQFVAVTFITAGAFVLERDFKAGLLNLLQYQEAKEMLAAASALLSSCCEVVVELDSNGVILSEAADLGSFLLRGPSLSLQGSSLADLLVDPEERQHFNERLTAPKLGDLGLAENMPVSMKDANSTLLRLELMWFQFRRLDGHWYYKVGIREFADGMAAHLRQQQPSEQSLCSPMALAEDSSMSSFSETMSRNSGSLRGPDPMVIVDCSTMDLYIHAINAEFAARVGRLPVDASFIAYVTRPMQFLSWFQGEFNEVLNCTDAEGISGTSYSVTLRMPQGKMRAICRLAEEEQHDLVRVALSFHSIRRQNGPAEGDELAPGAQRSGSLKGTPITHVML